MANDYFNHTTNVIASGVRALAAQVNNIAVEISVGLDKLPTEVQLKQGTTRYAVGSGAADAYVVTLPHVPTLTDGLNFRFKPAANNTGASTVNVNALGAKSIVYFDGTALTANAIVASNPIEVQYDATNDRFVMMSQSGKTVAIGDASTLNGLSDTQFIRSDVGQLISINETGFTAYNFSEPSLTSGKVMRIATSSAAFTGDGLLVEITDPGATGTALNVLHQGAGTALNIEQQGAGRGIQVVHTGANGVVLDISANNASRTFDVVNIAQSHASSTADLMKLTQSGSGNALSITCDVGAGLSVSSQGSIATTGAQALIYSNNPSATTDRLSVIQDHASATSIALNVLQDGSGHAIYSEVTSTSARAARFYTASGVRTQALVEIEDASTNTGTQAALKVTTSTAGNAIDIVASDVQGTALRAIAATASRTQPLAELIISNATGSGQGLLISQAQSGHALTSQADNAAGRAGHFRSNTASRTVPVVEIINDNATGAGVALKIQQDQDGHGIDIDHNHVSGAGAAINIDVTNATGMRFTSTNSGTIALNMSAWNSGRLIDATNPPGLTTNDMIGLQSDSITTGRMISVYSNSTVKATTPLVRLNQASATPTVPVLEINQAGDAENIILNTGQGIKFNTSPSTDVNTLDDYQEGTWNAVISDGTNNATMSVTECRYTKIGRMVYIYGRVTTTSLGSVSGSLRLTGLPFDPPAAATIVSGITFVEATGLAIPLESNITGRFINGGDYILLNAWIATAGTSALTSTHWTADGSADFFGFYETDV